MELGICSVEYSIKDNKPIIHLFCRDKERKKYIITDTTFLPYFYIEKRDLDLVLEYIPELIKEYYEEEYQSIDYETVLKIETNIPPDVKIARTLLHKKGIKTFEADILFTLRYLIDKNIFYTIDYDIYKKKILGSGSNSFSPDLRWLTIDIEVLAKNKEELKNYTGEVIVVSIYDSYTNEIFIFSTSPKKTLKSFLRKYLIDKNISLKLRIFENEIELLSYFKKYIREKDPDVILSFSTFDLNYLVNRMILKGIRIKNLSPINVVSRRKDSVKISGIQILDITEMFATTLRRSKWETLEDIAKKELGIDALFHNEQVYDMWNEERYKDVLIRNLRDTELVKILNEELQLLTYFDTIRKAVGCNLSDALIRSRIQDILDLRMGRRYNIILPTRKYYRHYDYTGARVFKCKKGIYDNVLVLDFKGMYPSIIRAFNIGYSTFIRTTIVNEFIEVKDLKDRFKIGEIPSFIIEELDMLEPIREPYKKRLKTITDPKEYKRVKAISDALKSIINSLYGKFGYSGKWEYYIPASRLYEPNIAAAITKAGRICQEAIFNYLNNKGKEVLYGDTDSLFIKLETNEIEKESEDIVTDLNLFLEEFLKKEYNVKNVTLKLEIDKIFIRLVLLTKKRYAGKKIDGSIEWKGLEAIKRDQAIVTQEIQQELIKRILEEEEKEKILNFFLTYCKNFKNKDIEKIAIPLKLTKKINEYSAISYHLKAFLYSKNILHIDLEEGERFFLCYIKSLPKDYPYTFKISTDKIEEKTYRVEAIAFKKKEELPEGFEIDRNKMLEKTVINKSEEILELLDIDVESIRRKVKGYTTLEEYI